MFTSSTMMRIINPHYSIKQQAGPCHVELDSLEEGFQRPWADAAVQSSHNQCRGYLWTLLVPCRACDPPQKQPHFSWKTRVAYETTAQRWNSRWPYHSYDSPWLLIAAMVGFRLICRHFIIYTKCCGSLINISGLFPNNFSIRSWWKQAVSTPGRNTLLVAAGAVWPSGLPGESPSRKAGTGSQGSIPGANWVWEEGDHCVKKVMIPLPSKGFRG